MKISKFISDLAERFEDEAPNEAVLGAKISTVSFLFAMAGMGVVIVGYETIGKVIVWSFGFGFFCGMFMMFIGFLNKSHSDKEDMKQHMDRYENPKQPWE